MDVVSSYGPVVTRCRPSTLRVRATYFLLSFFAAFCSLPLFAGDSSPTPTPTIRAAIGPYFAPISSTELRQAGSRFSELLAVELSSQPKFQVVERQQVNGLIQEMKLGMAGLTSRQTVSEFGKMLSCDWVITGSLVETRNGVHVWTKIIDARTGVIVGMNATPYLPARMNLTVSNVMAFLATAEPRSTPRQLLAVGRIFGVRPRTTKGREDWSRRIQALLEREFSAAADFGVLEMEAVTSLFEERRLAANNGKPGDEIQGSSACWFIDGGWKWIDETSNRLWIGLRVQLVGGPEQFFRFESDSKEAESAILKAIRQGLANTNRFPDLEPTSAEIMILNYRATEMMEMRMPFRWEFNPGQTWLDILQREQEHLEIAEENRRRLTATYEYRLLREPTDLWAKLKLGNFLADDFDEGRRDFGKALLQEVAGSDNPDLRMQARSYLEQLDLHIRHVDESMRERLPSTDKDGLEAAIARNPSDWDSKYKLGRLLLRSTSHVDIGRGKGLLTEVVAEAEDESLVKLAGKWLPKPVSTP